MSRRSKDLILESLTYLASLIGVSILVIIIGFVFIKGFKTLSLDFIFNKYNTDPFWAKVEKTNDYVYETSDDFPNDIVWSTKWGIGLKETRNRKNDKVVIIAYIHEDSPLQNKAIIYSGSSNDDKTNKEILITEGFIVSRFKTDFPQPASNASKVIEAIDQSDFLFLEITKPAGGIRGSILTTLIMIVVTLILALPFGIAIALYLTEYAKKTKIVFVMRSMIDMLAGVPSIVYGIFGVLLFFRYFKIGGVQGGYSILGGALTLVAILLPVIIRATEEALLAVPQELRQASLALGANSQQTIFKIVIPSAIPGILTATILSIGRIIGESAALILVAGTAINDNPSLREGGATLAVQIWKEMAGEQPNVPVAAAISILIIIIVLILNLLVKFTSKYLNKANY